MFTNLVIRSKKVKQLKVGVASLWLNWMVWLPFCLKGVRKPQLHSPFNLQVTFLMVKIQCGFQKLSILTSLLFQADKLLTLQLSTCTVLSQHITFLTCQYVIKNDRWLLEDNGSSMAVSQCISLTYGWMQTVGFCAVFNNVFLGEFAGEEKKPNKKANRMWNRYGYSEYSCEKHPVWPVFKN